MIAKDLMQTDVLAVREDDLVEELVDVLVGEHLHGAPVINDTGELVGVVTQQDIFFGSMTDGDSPRKEPLRVSDIMTSPAVSVGEDTDVVAVCRVMSRLRIHRVPVACDNRVRGIISSLDVCAAVARGEKLA